MITFFDTETTGLPDFKAPPEAKHQPRVVQFAAILTDDAGVEQMSVNLIVRPDGFEIPAEASAIHGITTERALAVGVEFSVVAAIYSRLATVSDLVVGHNVKFDMFLMYSNMEHIPHSPDARPSKTFCTMQSMTPLCKLPGKYGFKWPKLQEAYKHAFGKEFEGAHDALADVRACKDVYFWLKNNQPKSA